MAKNEKHAVPAPPPAVELPGKYVGLERIDKGWALVVLEKGGKRVLNTYAERSTAVLDLRVAVVRELMAPLAASATAVGS